MRFFVIDKDNESNEAGTPNNQEIKLNNFSPRNKITETDDEKPALIEVHLFKVKTPKEFTRFAQTKPEIPECFLKSLSGTDSSLEDYTQSKKNAKTTRNSCASSKKKIETVTLCEKVSGTPVKNNNYRNSKLISFGKKQNTTHQNFLESEIDQTKVINEEGDDTKNEKNEDEEIHPPAFSELASPKKTLLDTLSPQQRQTQKRSKVDLPQFVTDSCQNHHIGSPTHLNSQIYNTTNNELKLSNNPSSDPKFNSKLYKLISQFYIVKKFMTSIINATIYRKPKKLRALHYGLINDWTAYPKLVNGKAIDDEESQDGDWIEHLYEIITRCLLNLKKKYELCAKFARFLRKTVKFVFHPNHPIKMIWDIIHLILIIAYLVIIPLNLGFQVNIFEFYSTDQPTFLYFIRLFSFCFFIIDVVVSFNTAYYEKGELIENRQKITRNYLKTTFISDIVSLFYLYDKILRINDFGRTIPDDSVLNFLGLLFLLRVSKLNRIISRIEEFLFVDEKFYNTFSLFRLICFIIFVSHLFACAWHFIAIERANEEITWLQFYNIYDKEWWTKYIFSFYYVVIVMNTVGFGDIVPQTLTERVYSIFFIYVACGIFAYAINCIGLVLQDINKTNHNLKKTILLINAYMKEKNINVDLRIRIRKYIEYIWQEERGQNESETQNIINKLSRNLKEELLLNANGVVLREFPVFYQHFSEDSLRKLVYHIKEINLTPGDLIYNMNELEADLCLYIVRKGVIELFVDTPRSSKQPYTVLRALRENEIFGEYSFFSEMPRETSARSSGFTTLFLIRKEDFLSIIKSNSDDYEVYCQLKDRINLYQELEGLYQTCPACKRDDHNVMNCSMLHIILSKHRILQRYNHSHPQSRAVYQRRLEKNPHALRNFEKHENIAQKFSHDLNSDDSDDDSSDVSASVSNIKMDIKKEFNHMESDVTNDLNTINQTAVDEKNVSSASPKFQGKKKSILRFPSKMALEPPESLISNKTIDISPANQYSIALPNKSLINVNNNNPNNPTTPRDIRRTRSSLRRKPGTTVVASLNRQTSKDSLSKNSIYSKKSSKSNKSIKFFPYEVSLTQNTNDDPRENKKGVLLQDIRNPNRQFSNITSNRQLKSGGDDDFSEYMGFIKKERTKIFQANNFSDYSIRSKSHKSKDSKKSSNKTKSEQQQQQPIQTLNPGTEKPFTTLLEIDKVNYEDISKSYEFYFPHNNMDEVLEKIRQDSFKKRKKKFMGRVNTKNNDKTDISLNYDVIDFMMAQQQNRSNSLRRRGGKINIFKKNNFFKRKISDKFNFDKKIIKRMLKGRESLWRRFKILLQGIFLKIFGGMKNYEKKKKPEK